MKPDRLCALPSQTLGPFFHLGLTANRELGFLAGPAALGRRIRVRLRLLDGNDLAVPDGMIEIWQADAAGRYDHPADTRDQAPDPDFRGFGRLATDPSGCCLFHTVYPGPVPDGRGGCQAPHLNLTVFARGLLRRLSTRLYFAGDPALAADPVLSLVPEDRRATLLASPDPPQPDQWTFDIRLQGENETVFFDL